MMQRIGLYVKIGLVGLAIGIGIAGMTIEVSEFKDSIRMTETLEWHRRIQRERELDRAIRIRHNRIRIKAARQGGYSPDPEWYRPVKGVWRP